MSKIAIETIRQGRHWEIVSVARANRNEVAGFLDGLPTQSQKKIVRLFRILSDDADGPFMFRSEQKMRHLGEELYELKSDQVRLVFFVDRPRRMVVATGFLKKTQKTPRAEIERARFQRAAYDEEAR